MKKNLLLMAAACVLNVAGAWAQTDVTEQYIPNADFESCEALPVSTVHDNLKGIDVQVASCYGDYSKAQGTDFSDKGWKLVEPLKSSNSGVIEYGVTERVQYSKYNTAGDPAPTAGPTGTTGKKGLLFAGTNPVIYQQAEAVTLPAGTYTLTINVWARNGQTSNPPATQEVVNIKAGFMPEKENATDDDLIPALRKSLQFTSNGWDQEVLAIELTQPTTGRFQLAYGTSYFVVIDDLKLEYSGGVVTTALTNVIKKAEALNASLEDNDLTTAIATAKAFVLEPTTQEDVPAQVSALQTAMSTALVAANRLVDITAAYVGNASFETGKIDPWQWNISSGLVNMPTNKDSKPYIDGTYMVEFTSNGTNGLLQTIENLPAGYYAVSAKLNQKAFLSIGSNKTLIQGGKDALYLLCYPAVLQTTQAGSVTIGANASTTFRVDDFHLYYAPDAESLSNMLINEAKANASALLAEEGLACITGSERTALTTALEGTDLTTLNTAANNFYTALDEYKQLASAKEAAAAYTPELYPYASADIYQQIQDMMTAEATSAKDATSKAEQLNTLCFNYYVSNFYCEGVEATDYTSKILGANATENASGWGVKNMAIRTDKAGWKNPKTDETDKVVYGVTTDYYRACKDEASILKQTLTNLPAGTYALSMTVMGSNNLPIYVFFNNELIGTITTSGTAGGGKYGAGWNDYVITFTKADATDMPLQLQCKPTANYQEWYIDNFRLYLLTNGGSGIDSIEKGTLTTDKYYDLSGRQVAQPKKGLYIMNGKKMLVK